MGLEIERRFLVRNRDWDLLGVQQSWLIRQKTVARDPNGTITRLRLRRPPGADDGRGEAFITIKRAGLKQEGITALIRPEKDWRVPYEETREEFESHSGRGIQKTRHVVQLGIDHWEIDVFEDANEGLVIAEIESPTPEKSAELGTDVSPFPSWLGEEVTNDPRYGNASLELNPWPLWGRPCRYCRHLVGDHGAVGNCTKCSCCLDQVGIRGDGKRP